MTDLAQSFANRSNFIIKTADEDFAKAKARRDAAQAAFDDAKAKYEANAAADDYDSLRANYWRKESSLNFWEQNYQYYKGRQEGVAYALRLLDEYLTFTAEKSA